MTEINRAMLRLAAEPNALFVGQSVKYGGTSMYADLDGIPDEQRIEFPVAEDLQMGFCTGLAMMGYLPVCIFPRMDFMLRAMDQLVNHLDKMEEMSCGQFKPKVIVRTRVGSKSPLNAGPQHTQNHGDSFCEMLKNVVILYTYHEHHIPMVYEYAISSAKPVLVVEYS